MIKLETHNRPGPSRTRPSGATGDLAGAEMLLDEALSRTRQSEAE
jgi:hypothetical protein